MAPVATHTMTETPRGSLKLQPPAPQDPDSVARNQLPGPLSNLGLIEQYPVSVLHLRPSLDADNAALRGDSSNWSRV